LSKYKFKIWLDILDIKILFLDLGLLILILLMFENVVNMVNDFFSWDKDLRFLIIGLISILYQRLGSQNQSDFTPFRFATGGQNDDGNIGYEAASKPFISCSVLETF
jgi:hypothetical protein